MSLIIDRKPGKAITGMLGDRSIRISAFVFNVGRKSNRFLTAIHYGTTSNKAVWLGYIDLSTL